VVGPPEDAVFTVSPTHYVFTNRVPHKGLITCADGSSDSFNAGPATLVELHPGCTAKSQTHAATAPMDISQTVPSVIAQWPDDPAKLLQDIDLAFMEDINARQDIRALLPEDAAEAAAWLQNRQVEEIQTTTGWVHTGLITTIFLLLLATGAGMAACWWQRTKLKRAALRIHRSQHIADQVKARADWLRTAAADMIRPSAHPPTPVPWCRDTAKRELSSQRRKEQTPAQDSKREDTGPIYETTDSVAYIQPRESPGSAPPQEADRNDLQNSSASHLGSRY
jgi:hypothetical protein